MSTPTLESVVDELYGDNGLTTAEQTALRAELHELRRKAWHWDEARRISGGTIPFRQRQVEIAVLVAGDGDAEWERKAQEATR